MAPLDAQARELQRRLRFDTPFWAGGVRREGGRWVTPGPGEFQGCVKIVDKQSQLVPLIARPWQLEFDQVLERQRAAGLPMRAIVLKARKLGFCLDPATRVLTADLRWVRIDELEVGEQVVATDEDVPGGRGRGRKMRVGVVEAKREVREEAFLLRFDDGRSVVATAPHRWLCRRRGGTEADWRAVSAMRVGDYVRHVTEPWERGGLEDGWLGGLIDGEGCLGVKGELAISQRPSELLDDARDYLRAEGYSFREELSKRGERSEGRHQDNAKLIVGRLNELFRLVGKCRPHRFLAERRWWDGRDLPGKRTGIAWAKVVEIRPLGRRRMIDLQTDRKTFIAEGFVSHNSTWVAVKFLQRLTQLEYQVAVVTAQDTKTAGFIHDMAKRAYSHLPTEAQLGLGFAIKPALIGAHFTATGRKYMEFGEPSRRLRLEGRTGSSIFEIDTAGSPEAGRGYTINMLHLSEVARWEGEQATQKMISQLNAVPYEPETIVVMESTANGLNHFHRRYMAARDGSSDPDTGETYAAIFVPWWRDPACQMGFTTDEERERFVASIGDESHYGELASDEPMLQELYGLSAEQLRWRRMMVRTQHEGNVQLFKQENPASDDEAFIGSGRTVFSGILVTKAIKAAMEAPAPVLGTLRASGWETRRSRAGTLNVPTGAEWVPAEQMRAGEHELQVWEHPRQDSRPWAASLELPAPPTASSDPEQVAEYARALARVEGVRAEQDLGRGAYVIGVDVAEGEANTFTEGDFHCVQVFDHNTLQQVAVHASRMDIHELPPWLLLIALYFNRAILAVEVTGPGIAVADPLHKDYRYTRMYRRKRIDRLSKEEERKPGWSTDRATKPAMEATFGQALMEGTHGLRDVRTARELTTYVVDERGRHGALYGEHDDRLMAAMIAHRVIDTTRPPRQGGGSRGLREPEDRVTGY